jgi:lipopolysaccharide export system permease protein
MTLGLYFARRFLVTYLLVTVVFTSILLMIDIIEQLRKTGVSLATAFYLSLLNVPESLYKILPLIVILTAIAVFLGLARSSELVVVRAAGQSGLRFLLAPVATALSIGLISVAVFNPLVAATSKAYDRLTGLGVSAVSVLSISADGLWMRQGMGTSQSVINAARTNPDGSELHQVSFLTFDTNGIPIRRLEASSAKLEPGHWALSRVKQWDLQADNPEKTAQLQAQLQVPTDLTIAKISEGIGAPSTVAFWNLPQYIAALQKAGFSARKYQVWFQMELALPILLVGMVLIAAGFTMRPARFGKTGQMVMLALSSGFLIFFLRSFAQVLGENGQIPIVLAAWAPPVATALLGLGLLLHLEDG